MWKYILLIIFFVLCFPVIAQEKLKATITQEWKIDDIRKEAFRNIEYKKDLSNFPALDPDLIENREAYNKKLIKIKNKEIMYFSDRVYGIRIIEDGLFDKCFCYDYSGKLLEIAFDSYLTPINNVEEYNKINKSLDFYPLKSYTYIYPEGNLEYVVIYINDQKSYLFKPDGELAGYWIGKKAYDANGNVLGTRW